MAKKLCPFCNKSFAATARFCPIDGNPLVAVEEEITDQLVGMVLDGKYQIEKLLGKGGMGNVYSGKHVHMGIPIAVKVLHPHLVTDSTAVERFRREARSAHTVKHPNAISVMDFGVTNNNVLYLVMELIEGISLNEILKRETSLECVRAVKLMKQVCLAVDTAHQKNIVHRDLKPDNILIIDYGKTKEIVKVIDFSIAKIRQNDNTENPELSLTRSGVVVGTPQYISPEQAQGLDIDARSDIYSMGIILYQMLTGDVPFKAKTPAALLMKHINTPPAPLRETKPEIPAELEAAVLRALAKEPADRQQSAAIFAEEIEMALVAAGFIDMSSNPNMRPMSATAPIAVNPPPQRVTIAEQADETTETDLPQAEAAEAGLAEPAAASDGGDGGDINDEQRKKPTLWQRLFKRD